MPYLPGWLPTDAADAVLDAVRPVVTYAAGDDRATGHLFIDGAQPWPAGLERLGPTLLADLEETTGVRYPIVAFQGYRGGSGCDWHSDEPFGAQAVLSLGVTRTFEIRPTRTHPAVIRFDVAHGDLFVMPDGFQHEWQHRVPVEEQAGERVSLVFRTPANH